MREYINIGTSPADEECVQTDSSSPGYLAKQRAECKRFLALIKQVCGEPPPHTSLGIKEFQHDYGPYAEVVVNYETEDEESVSYALHCEANSPIQWDGTGGKKWKE